MPLRVYIRLILYILFVAATLFFSAGRLDWTAAGVFLGVYIAIILISLVFIDPELIEERSHIGPGAKRWDLVLASLVVVFLFPATFIVAGLDAGRFNWSPPFPIWVQLLALLVFILGSAIPSWAMATNKFFSTVVRIQKERGHYVVTGGPYKYVRHPGYTGAIVVSISIPLLLGSLWALIPALIGDCILVVRTVLEDNTLKKELDGYKDYANRVRYRLLPGIW
ncbi:MAG: isoprenylcysteine carboxylmethyltransferase family protein [Thermodesulfobacteriales bacterium]|nr:MAG: isoprenylcysteine carboxylmethyltransferase family protein [Thermodesulfobacteriales bacterium]